MSLGVEHEDGVIDNRLDQLLVSASIEPAGFVAFRHRLSLKRVLAGHGQRTREARLLIPAELGGSGTTFQLKCRVASQRSAPELIVRCLTPMFPTLTLVPQHSDYDSLAGCLRVAVGLG